MHFQKNNLFFRGWLLLALLTLLTGCQVQSGRKTTDLTSPKVTQSPSPTPTKNESAPPMNQLVGQATTQIFDNFPERNTNLKLAIQTIHEKVLAPGEEFSFNQTVGPRTKEKGYQEATGYDEAGEKIPTIGGGVCQISSTLYMAAKNGGFSITERHSHSHQVPYADSDNDATVSYEGYDFKFQNNRDKPVTIHISTDGKNVYAELILINE